MSSTSVPRGTSANTSTAARHSTSSARRAAPDPTVSDRSIPYDMLFMVTGGNIDPWVSEAGLRQPSGRPATGSELVYLRPRPAEPKTAAQKQAQQLGEEALQLSIYKKYASALELFRRARELDPGKARWAGGYARCLENLERPCLDAWREAGKNFPHDTEVQAGLMLALAERGETVEPLAIFEGPCRGDWRLRDKLASAFREKGQAGAAVRVSTGCKEASHLDIGDFILSEAALEKRSIVTELLRAGGSELHQRAYRAMVENLDDLLEMHGPSLLFSYAAIMVKKFPENRDYAALKAQLDRE